MLIIVKSSNYTIPSWAPRIKDSRNPLWELPEPHKDPWNLIKNLWNFQGLMEPYMEPYRHKAGFFKKFFVGGISK